MHVIHLVLLMVALLVSDASHAQQLGPGTGFFVTTNGDVLTNHHVVAKCAKLKIVRGEDTWPPKVVASNKSDDSW
jgi:S1-C subfamily serine protease